MSQQFAKTTQYPAPCTQAPRILILGCGGQVGWELQRALAPLGEVIALDFDSTDYCGDFSQPEAVAATVRAIRPDVIVNSAAHTAVDKAESEPDLARLLNATTPGAVAQVAAEIGALLVHYSTDYVFDGCGAAPRDETAPTGPLSVYGQTKLEGEQLIQQSGCRHLILRTSWVYAARGGNFAKTMLRLAGEREQLSIIADQIGAPTGADLLADVSAHAVKQYLGTRHAAAGSYPFGLYHCVAAGETNWYDYAQFVFAQARALGVELKVREVSAIPTSAYPTPARRPLNSRLDTRKLQAAFGLTLPDWKAGVARMLREHLGR
ncbi:dTDP-4-dehydrorhamnose reductase [Uliginosibacterium sp. 31-16]|uniref:dTDP-4-dehydrorhamnose reductase n=1 Tax=Uliginosibacterium sp. 31-16 TaxID=3068315 RepID=UPI00273E467F|nr:dTDP-4-dehydrorhamnose reductase [Uliginosibacterium sp. 31-16]MDP5238067.1 dTDP-4-dehydrorhamnose reductase [Uliginosibacterium sp. 31-16]